MSFPRYPKYKDSGVEWLGDVPEHWETRQIKRVATIRYGIGEPPKYHDEGTPLIRATNVHAGKLFPEGMVFVDPTEIPAQRIVWLQAGDIIVVRSGAYTGDSAIIPEGIGECIAGFDMVLRCHAVRPLFIQFSLLSSYLKEGQIDLEKMRAAQPHLNAEELGSCIVVLPSEVEQERIAEFLEAETSKIDELVAEQRRLIELLKEKRQAVISHAVTKGLNPNVPMRPSGIEWLGDVPEHWEVMKGGFIGTLFGSESVKEDQVCEEGNLPFIKVGSMSNDTFDIKSWDWFVDPSVEGNYRTRCDYVVFPKRGAAIFLNKVNVVERPSLIDPNLMGWEIGKRADSYFIAYLLKARKLDELADVSTVPQINNKHIAPEQFPVPPVDEQKAIVAYLNATAMKLDSLLAEAERGIELLQERRTALISAAVTGKIDVRSFAPQVSEVA